MNMEQTDTTTIIFSDYLLPILQSINDLEDAKDSYILALNISNANDKIRFRLLGKLNRCTTIEEIKTLTKESIENGKVIKKSKKTENLTEEEINDLKKLTVNLNELKGD